MEVLVELAGAIANAFFQAFFKNLMEHLPQLEVFLKDLLQFWKTANSTTLTNATPVPQNTVDAVQKEITDAINSK